MVKRILWSIAALLAALIAKGIAVEGVPFDETWGEVDSPKDLEVLEQALCPANASS